MSAPREIKHDQDARDGIFAGVEKLSRTVASTLGPKGRPVILGKEFGYPRITKDGVTVAKDIVLENKFENIGAQIVKGAASQTAESAGDGTTTATILAEMMTRTALRLIASGVNAVEIRDDAENAVADIVKNLAQDSISLKGEDEQIAQVAIISANGDKEVGNMIAEAMKLVGNDGVITVEESKSMRMELEVVKGMRLDNGYVSPYFVTNHAKMLCEMENPLILLHEKKISSIQSILPVLEKVAQEGKALVVFAEDFEAEVLGMFVANRLRGGLRIVAVKAPGFGERRKAMMEDLAVLTQAQVISEEIGMKLEKVDISFLGAAKKVTVSKDHVTVLEGAGKKPAIEERCAHIRAQIAETTSDYDREKLQERLARLTGGIAVIRVGGATEMEVKERKDRVDDAVHATKAAIEEGIVAGGGTALIAAARMLFLEQEDAKKKGLPFGYGKQCVLSAIQAPLRQIAKNAGKEDGVVFSHVFEKLIHGKEKNYGYDARNDVYGDMIKMGIIDPSKVTRLALQTATSVACTLITTGAVVAEKKELPAAAPAAGMGGMGGMGGMDF